MTTQEQQDPYVIYQLRKPHQRGTAVVPRLVPKSHAPAFSQANYRFARVRSRLPGANNSNANNPDDSRNNDPDDASLYLPKSLEYPTNWGSFGSESSIWSQSSGPSAFPNRVTPLFKSLTRTSLPSTKAPSILDIIPQNDPSTQDHNDNISLTVSDSSSRIIDIDRPSLLSSDAPNHDGALKSFVRFDAPQLSADLPAPEALRPNVSAASGENFPFVLPPALAQVEKEDRIVQAAIDDPGSVRSTEEILDLEGSINTNLLPLKQVHTPPPISSIATKRMEEAERRRVRTSNASQTRRRRGLFAWLFGGGERAKDANNDDVTGAENVDPGSVNAMKRSGGKYRKYADAHVAPIMDEEEEAFRRAQFVRGANGGRTKSGPRLSWGRLSMERKQRQSTERNTGERKSKGLGGSAKNIWNKLKRSASFTFGQKLQHRRAKDDDGIIVINEDNEGSNYENNNNRRNNNKKPTMVAGLHDDPIVPSSSFIQRKMASLRENTAKRMVNAGKSHQNTRDVFNIPAERREDRPRIKATAGNNNNVAHEIHGETTYNNNNNTARPTLDQLISARPDLYYATSEAVEKLANRINSDLSQGTTLRSMSFGSKEMGHVSQVIGETSNSHPKLQESLISSSEGNSFDSFAPVLCEAESASAADLISDRLRANSNSNNVRSPATRSNSKKGRGATGCLSPSSSGNSRELRLSNTSRMSIELLRARAAQTPLRPTEYDIEFSPPHNNVGSTQQIAIGAVAEAKRRRKKMVGEAVDSTRNNNNYKFGGDNNNIYRRVIEFETQVGNTIADEREREEEKIQLRRRRNNNNNNDHYNNRIGKQHRKGGYNRSPGAGIITTADEGRERMAAEGDTRGRITGSTNTTITTGGRGRTGNTKYSRENKSGLQSEGMREIRGRRNNNSSNTGNGFTSVTERVNALNGVIATEEQVAVREYKEHRISQIPEIRRDMAVSGYNTNNNDNNDYPTDLESFCECGCSCVYMADCKHCHDDVKSSCCGSGRSGNSAQVAGINNTMDDVQSISSGRRFYSPSAQSPCLSVINGHRDSLGKTAASNEAWTETMLTRVDKLGQYGNNNNYGSGSTDWAIRYGVKKNNIGTNNTTDNNSDMVVVKAGRPVSTPATSPPSSDKRVSSIDMDANELLAARLFANKVAYDINNNNNNGESNNSNNKELKKSGSARKLLGRLRRQ